jgi:hypothetical protein
MRRSLTVLEQGLARRAAVGGVDRGSDGLALGEADRDRLREFRDSLPAPVPRLTFLAFVVAYLILMQALLNGLPPLISGPDRREAQGRGGSPWPFARHHV